ncbi:MAG: hypothetical protein KDA45_05075, partial [Planctomycetales bacterium]|nr:hypothetical protein [Planctomycetales bacterium]
MFLFLKRYLTALLCLLLTMAGYSLLLVPAIEPPPRQPAPLPAFAGALGGQQWWQSLFPAGAWQTKTPTILQSSRGILLSDAWEQVGPKTLKVKLLTMILPQTTAQAPPPGGLRAENMAQQDVWIVSAEEGAVIHFEKPLDLTSGAIPSVERGHLSGLIQITRKTAGQAAERPWSLRTSELSIDRSHIFTQQAVTIEWAEGTIEGHDMKLTLRGDLLSPRGKETSAWGPLRTLELYHVDRIDMGLPPGGLWAAAGLPLAPPHAAAGDRPARVGLSCGGRFTFDFTRSQATLLGGVHLQHQLAGLPPDEFLSQEVVIDIEPPPRKENLRTVQRLGTSGLQLKEIEARGIDSLENFVGERKVEIKAPTIGAFATAKRLKINVAEQRLELDGRLQHAGATQSTAWLKYMDYEFTSPRIAYDADGAGPTAAAGTAASATHLGYLVAKGAGELRMPSQAKLGGGLIRWQESLEMRPTETAGLQWVQLLGNVLVESGPHG